MKERQKEGRAHQSVHDTHQETEEGRRGTQEACNEEQGVRDDEGHN